jgi:Beta-galactosidase/beta-glucuronidase
LDKTFIALEIASLKDMGINAIRPSHNPTPPMFYDICDEIGLLVMDEILMVGIKSTSRLWETSF